MSNKPIVPMFRAEAPDHSSDEIKVPFTVNGHIEFITDENVCMVDMEGGCWCCQLNTLQMSLNNGTTWYSMQDVKELISLGEKYDRINSRGGRITYPLICCECQKETCICEKNYDQ